jgi:hypothetical protein
MNSSSISFGDLPENCGLHDGKEQPQKQRLDYYCDRRRVKARKVATIARHPNKSAVVTQTEVILKIFLNHID